MVVEEGGKAGLRLVIVGWKFENRGVWEVMGMCGNGERMRAGGDAEVLKDGRQSRMLGNRENELKVNDEFEIKL